MEEIIIVVSVVRIYDFDCGDVDEFDWIVEFVC